MAFWVSAYCTADTVPTIRSLVTWLRKEGGYKKAEARFEGPDEPDSPDWESFELVYNPRKKSIQVECNRNTGEDSLCAGQAQGELDSLEDLEPSEAKERVADCLRKTRFIICCTVMMGDHGHKESFNVRKILDYFVDHCGAILDVEDEGFYARSDQPLLGICADE
jgi:hypothetical protein